MNYSNGNEPLNNHTILVVNTGSAKKKFILQRLKALGLKIVVLNKEKNWAEPFVDHWILADTFNHVEAVAAVKAFMAANLDVKIEGALTFWEDDVLLASKIADKFNFIGIPFNVAKKARNKFLFREFCALHGLKTPAHSLVKNNEDLNYIVQNFKFPLVIKPTYGSSSAYVIKLENQEELFNTYQYLKKNISTDVESALTDGVEILVEEYIDGDEVDIDIVLQNGKIKFFSISDNDKTNEPFFVETGQSIPSGLPERTQSELIEMAEETLEKMGVQNGVIHFEAKAGKNGTVPIEANLRMGGDEVHSFVKGAWGVDLIECAVKIALGVHIPKIHRPVSPRKYLTGKYFLNDNSGILVKMDVVEDLKKNPNVEEIHFFKEIGDAILVPPEGYEFLGWVVVSGYNRLDAQDNLREIASKIHFDVVKFDSDSALGRTSRKSRFSSAVLNKTLLTRAARLEKLRSVSKDNQGKLKIGVLGNSSDENQESWEKSLAKVSEEVVASLKTKGYQVTFFDSSDFPKVVTDLKKSDVDLVFNLAEKINQSALAKSDITSVLEALQIPYTGSSPLTLALAQDKIKFKKMLAFHNIPTARWDYAYSPDDDIDESLRYPLIVKPAGGDHSLGINNQSVVNNKEELKTQLVFVTERLGSPALVEEYIEGDEYDVSILGSNFDDFEVLPLSRTIFKNLPVEYKNIYTFEAKWGTNPIYNDIIVQQPPKNIPKKLETLLTEIALDTYNILDCQDYGRVDIRVDQNDNPYVLELNANPSLAPDARIPSSAKILGIDYSDLLVEIITLAIKRYQQKPKNF
ncbi:MAG: ATP-grasp domain-containing protein [Patescibacteria group bacterium]|jgi:D-alanine--D-alanine ligase